MANCYSYLHRGESGEIQPASEFIPSSDYILKWDYPNLKQDGGLKGEPIQLQLSWSDENGSYQETLEILVTDDQGSKTDIYLNQSGLSQNKVEVGKKTKFFVKSTLYSTVKLSKFRVQFRQQMRVEHQKFLLL